MSEAVLQATIKAYDEFTQQFEKLQQELKKTEQVEQRVAATTQEVNAAMAGLVQAKTKAREATEKYNEVIADMARGGKRGADASAQLGIALNEVVAAERRVEQETTRLNKTLGGYNLTSKEAQAAIKQVDRALDELSRQHQRHGQHANNDMIQTMAMVSAFYGLVRALQSAIQTGREFELGIKQSQAVTGDMTSTLRDFAMAATDSIYAPRQLAETFYSLGSAGLSANETLTATPAIMAFATAGILDVDSAAYATISTIKAFRLEWEQAAEVTDAFTEAMNTTTLNAPDFRFIMASAGAVGKLAAQDFREVVAAAAAMKDAGVQAQDAGTSIKAAFLGLMAPSTQAKKVIDDLGIEIYNASGQMKQWHEIVAEFEQALAPYNDEARNMILSTILGTDGIRAMATSLNMGSDTLLSYVEGMRDADGATQAMASTMADTLDGALRRTNGNIERTKILLFEDLAPAATSTLGAINALVIGFNSMEESDRKVIEGIMGAAGLIVAIKALIGIAQTLGITLGTVTGPVGLLVMAVSAITGAIVIYKGRQEEATRKTQESIQGNLDQANSIKKLLAEYIELSTKTDKTKEEQEKLKTVVEDITGVMPAAITGFNDMGEAVTNLGTVSEEARKKIAALREESIRAAETNAQIAQSQLPELEKRANEAKTKLDTFIAPPTIRSGGSSLTDRLYTMWQTKILGKSGDEIGFESGEKLRKAQEEYVAASKAVADARAAIDLAEDLRKHGGVLPQPVTPPAAETKDPDDDGKDPFKLPGTGGNPARDAARAYVDAVTAALRPYEEAVNSASSAVAILGSKEQYLSQIMQSGQGTVYQAVELNKIRTGQLEALAEQQDILTGKTEAEAKQLADVRVQYNKATDPEAAKVLLQEVDKLTKSIYQYGQTWWQIEQQKLALTQKARQEEKKRFDDAYQQAMELMRHQVSMSQMSTEQQIEYLGRLKDAHTWTQQQMWGLEETIYRLRRQQLSEYLSAFENEHKDALEALDERTRETIQGLQDQIDALDTEGRTADREEAERKHGDRLTELQDKRKYHELRTGKAHEKALAELDEEIAEENRKWQLQQDDWARDDKKRALQDQIEATQEGAKEEQRRLEDHYREVVDLASQGALDTLAALAATNPQWMETGKNWIKNLMDGITLMEPEFQARVQQATAAMGVYQSELPTPSTAPSVPGQGNSPVAVIAPDQYIWAGGRPAMWSRELVSLLGGLPVNQDPSGAVNIGGKSFSPVEETSGKTYVSIREVAEALGYRVDWEGQGEIIKIYKAALGGIFTRPSMTMIGEAGYDEAVLPLPQLQPMINEAVKVSLVEEAKTMFSGVLNFPPELSTKLDQLITILGQLPMEKPGVVIEKFVGVENANMYDETDLEITAREIRREIELLGRV